MTPNKNFQYQLLFIAVLFWGSCTKVNLDNAELGDRTADYAFPLFSTEIKLKDLLVNLLNDTLSGDTIFVNPDNSVTLFYSGDVAEKKASDIFGFLQVGIFPMGDSVITTVIPGPTGVGVRVVDLKAGTLYFSLINTLQDTVTGYFDLPQMTKNGVPFRTSSFTVAPGKSWNSGVIDVADHRLNMNNNQLSFRYFAYTPNGNRVKVPNLSGFDVGVAFSNLKFSYLEGNWGNQEYQLTRDTIEIDINQTNLKGDVRVTNPKVTMRILNSWGFPTRGVIKYLSFIGQNGEEIPLNSTVFQQSPNGSKYVDFAYPLWSAGEIGQTKYTDINLDDTNSNIADIFNSQPTRLIYEVDGISNANSDPDVIGFLTDESAIRLQIRVELLLEGSVRNFGAEQTVPLDFSGMNSLDSAGIESVEFKLVTENGTPVDIDGQIYFRDETGVAVDSLFERGQSKIMTSAPVSNGVATDQTRTENFISMNAARFDHIRQTARSAFMKIFFTTAENGQVPVRFLAEDATTLKMGIRVKKRSE